MAATAIDGRTLFVQSEARRAVLRGAAVVAVAGQIDGRRSAAVIAQVLGASVNEVAHVLEALARSGYVEDAVADTPPAAAPGVALVAVGVDATHVALALEAAGLRVRDAAALELLVCEDLLDPRVLSHAASRRRALLLAKPGGRCATIGPWIDDTPGPCPHCLAHALAWNRPGQRFVQERLERPFVLPAPASAAELAAGAALLAQAVVRGLQGDRSLRDTLLAFDPHSLATSRHAVRQRPQCPACGDPGRMAVQGQSPPLLRSRIAAHRTDGGHRCRSPEDTLAAHRALVNPLTGVVQYLHPMPGRHTGQRKVYVAGYPACPQAWPQDNGFDKVCAGKGRTDAQAQASALCEALERASSVWQGDEATRRERRSVLGPSALSFDALQGFSARQFALRDTLNAMSTDRRRHVPLPFDDDAEIAWTPAWPLGGGDRRWVPLTYCYAETPPNDGAAFGIYNPNGTAAGNVLEEAVLQGLLELVERDATAIWWYQRVARPHLDLDRVDDPFVQALRADYAAEGWRVHVLDLTHDLGIPVAAAVARHDELDRHALGFGCHLQASIALNRALTELNQLLDSRPGAPAPWDRRLLPRADFLEPAGCSAGLPSLSPGHDLLEDIELCVQRLRGAGLETLVVDKTRPDIGLAVAQVIVPGLRHFWPRFGPGRLYEVPVALGWKAEADGEERLNPAALFL
jgi:ribosomal protein S12 methylthiotransferase accessory factor